MVGALLWIGSQMLCAQKPVMYSTTSTERWKECKLNFDKQPAEAADLQVYADSLLQPVSGFGVTFNELPWEALSSLPQDDRDRVMASLFGPEGCNFAWGRTPIGSSDYSYGYYSYNEVKDDYEMHNFTIGRDKFILIPFIKEALKHRPDLKMWASPWTPPAWMKVNEHYSQKSQGLNGTDRGHNRLDPKRNVLGNVTGFKMQQGYLQAWALYLSKYLQEYEKEGVHISVIMPQNEIAWTPCWPSCTWRPEDFAIFLTQYLVPQFQQDSIQTDIWLGTVNYPDPNYVRTFLRQKGAAQAVKGIGVQWTGMQALPFIHEEYPQYEYMQTENMCGDSENDWTALENTWKAVVHCFQNGVSSYMYWNMLLDTSCESWWGWPQNSLVIIDKQTRAVRYTDEYYLMKHLSRFVQPGSHLLKTSQSQDALAFVTADGHRVIVVYNSFEQDCEKTIQVDGKTIRIRLKAKSVNTLLV